jgi:hypothetical protein
METEIIDSVPSLLDLIAREKRVSGDNSLYFRGHKKHYETVTPSIGRNGLLENEDKLFREFILRNPDEFEGTRSTFQMLAKMQHYGLPTRLLDISSNPLISLFFAVEKDDAADKLDGEFVIFSIPQAYIKYYDADTVSVVSNIAKRPFKKLNVSRIKRKISQKENKQQWLKRFNEIPHIRYLLHEIKDEKPYFAHVIEKDHLQSIWCVKPLLNNRRIIKQDGAFLLFGLNGSKEKLAEYNPEAFVPKCFRVTNKAELREQLELLGVSKDKIYPELDTAAQYLKTKYEKV